LNNARIAFGGKVDYPKFRWYAFVTLIAATAAAMLPFTFMVAIGGMAGIGMKPPVIAD
jgi:hypothetical protein